MDPTNHFIPDPSWEHRMLSENEYASLLSEVAAMDEGSSLMVENHSFRVVGTVMRLWQTIRGCLGFENKTDPIKVNYELLKFLQYGENHHFLENERIVLLVEKLKNTLATKPQHQNIVEIIQRVLLSFPRGAPDFVPLKEDITKYRQIHLHELQEAFWPKLFHRYISPVKIDSQDVEMQALLAENYFKTDNAEHLQKLIAAEVQAGDQCLPEPVFDPEVLGKQTQEFVNFALRKDAPFASALQQAFNPPETWRSLAQGSSGTPNEPVQLTEFRSLGANSYNKTSNRIISDAEGALQVISSVSKHIKVSLLGDLPQKIQLLREQITTFRQNQEQAMRNHFEKPIAHYIQACELSGDQYGEQFNKLINAYVQNKDYEKAIQAYEKFHLKFSQQALRISPKAYLGQMENLIAQEEYTKAQELIQAAINQFPDNISLKKGLEHINFVKAMHMS